MTDLEKVREAVRAAWETDAGWLSATEVAMLDALIAAARAEERERCARVCETTFIPVPDQLRNSPFARSNEAWFVAQTWGNDVRHELAIRIRDYALEAKEQ